MKSAVIQTNSYVVDSLNISYTIFKTDSNFPEYDNTYGIRIVANQNSHVYSDEICDLTVNYELAFSIFNKLQDGLVTPITFRDVLIDLLS